MSTNQTQQASTPETDEFLLSHTAIRLDSPIAERMRDLERQLADAMETSEQRDRLAEACRSLLESEEVNKAWPINGTKRAEKPSDTFSGATATVKFRRLLAIHAVLAAVKETTNA